MAKAKQTSKVNLDFAFFNILWTFYDANRGQITKNYRELRFSGLPEVTLLRVALPKS